MAVRVQATFKLTGWNANQLKLRVPAILTAYDKVIYPQFKTELETERYGWPRATRRRNKTTVTSPRDIVDLGGLRRSQERIRSSATQLTYRWNAPYAALVLTGYETSRGTIVPGRDWIKPALDAIPLDRFFADQWRRLGGSGL
jgi:hypothetical protein